MTAQHAGRRPVIKQAAQGGRQGKAQNGVGHAICRHDEVIRKLIAGNGLPDRTAIVERLQGLTGGGEVALGLPIGGDLL